jgi:hypothetical protein
MEGRGFDIGLVNVSLGETREELFEFVSRSRIR